MRLGNPVKLKEKLSAHAATRYSIEPAFSEYLNTCVAAAMAFSTLTEDDNKIRLGLVLNHAFKTYQPGWPQFMFASVMEKYQRALADIIKQ
jgi:hypothetical protein